MFSKNQSLRDQTSSFCAVLCIIVFSIIQRLETAMKILRILISLVVGFLGLLAAVLGVVAEAKRVKPDDIVVHSNGTCSYPTSPSEALGIVAALVLLAAQLIANAAPGCVCCCGGLYSSSCKKTIAIICLVISWITCIVAFSSLMAGAVLSGPYMTTTDSLGNISCSYVRPGVFTGGAVFAILTVLCAIVYVILTVEVKNPIKGKPTQNQNIAMAQPQPPPYSGQP